MDEGFLDAFLVQFEKVRNRIASSEEEVLKAVTSIKEATGNAKRASHTTELNFPDPGISPSKIRHTIQSGLILQLHHW